MEKLSADQNRKIWAMAKEIGLEQETLRDIVDRVTGQRSISSLTRRKANLVIEELNRVAGKRPASATFRPGMASPAQIRKIRALEHQLGWSSDPKRLQAFMSKYCGGITKLEWLRDEQATKLIESLKGVMRSQLRKQGRV